MQPAKRDKRSKRLGLVLGLGLGALSLGLAAGWAAAAQAQDYGGYGIPYGRYGGPGPYGGPYGYGGPGPYGYRGPGPRDMDLVPVEIIEGRIYAAGYRLVARPRHKGHIYLAEVEDRKGTRHRLVYDAYDGHLIENTPLSPVKKQGGPLPSEASKAPKAGEPLKSEEPKGEEPKTGEVKSAPLEDQAKAAPAETPQGPDAPAPQTQEPAPAAPAPATEAK